MKKRQKIYTQDAEDVSELLNCHDQELTPNCLVKTRRQRALEKAEASRADPKERKVTVSKLTEVSG